MKRILFTLCLSLLTIISFAQAPTFTLSEEKPTFPNQFVAIEVDGLTIPDGYNRALEWINITYNTPSEVIKSQVENKYIRIEGVLNNGAVFASLKYNIEFKFKDNRVKFEVIKMEYYVASGGGKWINLVYLNSEKYKKNGKYKKAYANKANKVMTYFNELVLSMDTYLKKPIGETESGNDDW